MRKSKTDLTIHNVIIFQNKLPSSMLLGLLILIIACLLHFSSGQKDTPELCIVNSPFDTSYFKPWLETPRKAIGCWAASNGQEVHIIFLQSSHILPTVRLNIITMQANTYYNEDVSKLVLILMSDKKVDWKLQKVYKRDIEQESKFLHKPFPHVIISNGSTVEANFKINVSHHWWPNKRALQRYIHKQLQVFSSYTEIKGANLITLSIGGQWEENTCNLQGLTNSKVLTATHAIQLKAEGCFHENYVADEIMNVYVIEMNSGRKGKRLSRTLFPVVIHLKAGNSQMNTHNLTLVLKSDKPIRWQFKPEDNLHGNFIIVSDHKDQVENLGHQNLEVVQKLLPDKLDSLLLFVTTKFGPPALYAKTGQASALHLVVGSSKKKGLKLYPEMSSSSVVNDDDLFYDQTNPVANSNQEIMQNPPSLPDVAQTINSKEMQSRLLGILKEAMVVQCGETQINVSFPLVIFRQIGLPQLSFNDPSCQPIFNSTHLILSSHITSCGYTGQSNGKITAFSNVIRVKFPNSENIDDEDLESSGFYGDLQEGDKFAVVCKYYPRFFGEKPKAEVDNTLGSLTDVSGQLNLYKMELFMDRDWHHKLQFSSLNSNATLKVGFDETVYVKAWIEGPTEIQLVTENCWISNSSRPQSKPKIDLLRNACPVDLSVALLEGHGRFSFQANKGYLDLEHLFIHCRIGMCTSNVALTGGNLVSCVDTKQYCSRQSLRPFLDKSVSTAQQLISRGPLKLVPRVKKSLDNSGEPTVKPNKEIDSRTVYVGVSTEVTIAISLASFLIGVGLTGTLWYINLKTDPVRRPQNKQFQQQSGVAAPCNMSPNSACSSTNSYFT